MSDLFEKLNKIRQLEVVTPQGKSGLLHKESRFFFNYSENAEEGAAVSLVMPVRKESYSSGELLGIFAMNRPEGYLRYILEERFKRLGVPSDMFLLYLAGDNSIGRLQYFTKESLSDEGRGESLTDLLNLPSKELFNRLIEKYALRTGISGVQPKVVVPLKTETRLMSPADRVAIPLQSVIVKTESGEYPGLSRNEFFCMSVASEAGLNVPEFWLSDDGKIFIMSRFDRKQDGSAVGFEDMAVLTGRNERQKYEGSYEMLLRVVSAFCQENEYEESKKLFERVAISCWLRDGDAHLKNFGITYDTPISQRHLAPIYDVVCTDIYPELDGKMALKLNGSKTFPTYEELMNFGIQCGLSKQEVDEVFYDIECAYFRVLTRLQDDVRFVADGLLNKISTAIERTGLRSNSAMSYRG